MDIDAFIKQIQVDELADKAEQTAKLTPIEYARIRGMRPQRVYYALRNGKLRRETCACGRFVIDVALADAYFEAKEESQDDEEA
jgi:hypothetical protein